MVTPQPCCRPNPAAPDRNIEQQLGEAITAVGHYKQTDLGFTGFFFFNQITVWLLYSLSGSWVVVFSW